MRTIELVLENEEYERLLRLCEEQKREPAAAAREVLLEWLRGQEKRSGEEEWEVRKRYMRARLQEREPNLAAIAESLGLTEETLRRWDAEIRRDPQQWRRAFVFVNKSTDPLRWEMTIKDRFYDAWGHPPG